MRRISHCFSLSQTGPGTETQGGNGILSRGEGGGVAFVVDAKEASHVQAQAQQLSKRILLMRTPIMRLVVLSDIVAQSGRKSLQLLVSFIGVPPDQQFDDATSVALDIEG